MEHFINLLNNNQKKSNTFTLRLWVWQLKHMHDVNLMRFSVFDIFGKKN